MFVVMTTNVSWLKSLIISFGLFNSKVVVVITFVWMIIFLFQRVLWIFVIQDYLNERSLHCRFGTGFKCLSNQDNEFSKHCIF